MAKLSRPRFGSLQFYPRKRAAKFLPSVNWKTISAGEHGLLGFIAYKAGMASATIKDSTDKVMSSGKEIVIPVTVLEAPNMKIYSVRFYKFGKVMKEVVVSNDKELKRIVRHTKKEEKLEGNIPTDYEDIRVIVYSLPKNTAIKKTPDIIELAVNAENKLEYIKSLINKELTLSDLSKSDLLDVRGLTTGKGLVGAVKRFGITLRAHKSEKGVRRAGSLGPWHPARVTFHTPLAGQLGMFTRITYNLRVLGSGKISEKDINPSYGFKNYGKIKSNYLILSGSVQGPVKRQLLLTPSFRPTKLQSKKKYQLIEVLKK